MTERHVVAAGGGTGLRLKRGEQLRIIFMNADVASDGRLSLLAPRTRAGAALTVRAEMDLLIALTSCPASTCNAGATIRPLGFEVFS